MASPSMIFTVLFFFSPRWIMICVPRISALTCLLISQTMAFGTGVTDRSGDGVMRGQRIGGRGVASAFPLSAGLGLQPADVSVQSSAHITYNMLAILDETAYDSDPCSKSSRLANLRVKFVYRLTAEPQPLSRASSISLLSAREIQAGRGTDIIVPIDRHFHVRRSLDGESW